MSQDLSFAADPFEYLAEGHPWREKGTALTLENVVKDPKQKTTMKHIQRKLWWVVSQFEQIAKVVVRLTPPHSRKNPKTVHRPLISRLGLVLALEQFQQTLFSTVPKGKMRDEYFDVAFALFRHRLNSRRCSEPLK